MGGGKSVLELKAGERFHLTDENKFALVTAGNVEVYAATTRDVSFRQIFLMRLTEHDAAYPSLDEFEEIDIVLYAVEDSEISLIPFDEMRVADSARLMRQWFGKLIELQWLRIMADRGDEILVRWQSGEVLSGKEADEDGLRREFEENESIFAMLLGVRFTAQDENLAKRLNIRQQSKKKLVDSAMENLIGHELPGKQVSEGNLSRLDQATFIVARVAEALGMPTDNISLSPEIVKKLDQVGLLRRLVQKGNMQMRLISLEDGWHTSDNDVMIAYRGDEKELVALLPTGAGRYRLVSVKESGDRMVDDTEAKRIDKRAFACYAGFPTQAMKVRDLLNFMLRRSWKADRRAILFASFMAGIIPLITPIITETIFQDIIPILDRQGLSMVTQVSMVAAFTMAALSMVRSIAVLRISTHLDIATDAALWGRVLAFPTKFFRRFPTGELAQRMAGLQAVKSVMSEEFVGGVLNLIFSAWSLLLMAYYSLKLTAAAVVVWGIYLLGMGLIYRRISMIQAKLIEAKNDTASIVQQIFNGLAKFRIQGAEEEAYYLWSKAFGKEWQWNLKLRWRDNYSSITQAAEPLLLSVVLYYFVFYVVNNNNTTGIGYSQFLAFESAFTGFNMTINSFVPLLGQAFSIKPHIDNLRPMLETAPEITDDRVDAEALSGAIEVSHLTFSYSDDKPDVIHDMSFRIAAGEQVAIVGKSGCGKSTLVRLLLGFEEPKQGAIYYDGQDLSDLALPSVRSQMGVVLQNGQLMSGDIFTNIVGTTALSLQDAWDAAEAVGIADDIRKMPMGMQTVISEGSSNISGGQRQRILIARALAARPSIMIFDEATSALDNRTQAIVTKSLARMHATRIVVAHRLSTIKDADRILVLDKGHLVESGSFADLVAKGGIFADMVKRQVA